MLIEKLSALELVHAPGSVLLARTSSPCRASGSVQGGETERQPETLRLAEDTVRGFCIRARRQTGRETISAFRDFDFLSILSPRGR